MWQQHKTGRPTRLWNRKEKADMSVSAINETGNHTAVDAYERVAVVEFDIK